MEKREKSNTQAPESENACTVLSLVAKHSMNTQKLLAIGIIELGLSSNSSASTIICVSLGESFTFSELQN